MRVRVIAVGTRLPAWVRTACDDYLARLAPRLAVSLVEIEPGPRPAAGSAQQAVATEATTVSTTVRRPSSLASRLARAASVARRNFPQRSTS